MLSEGTRNRHTWSDDELSRAVETSTSWRGVLRTLGCKPTSAGLVTLMQRHAAQLGLDTSHFRGNRQWTDEQLVAALEKSHSWGGVLRELGLKPTSTTSKRGIQQRIAQLGLDASHITGKRRWTERYDMVVETTYGFKRVQVKSTTFFANGAWQASVSHRPDKNGKREPYSSADVDLFFIIDGDMNLYLIPIDALGGRIAINLRAYENFKVGHARSLIC